MIIAICGGIGAGKSVVSRILSTLGYDVFDCDRQARILMDNSLDMKTHINRHIAPGCLLDDLSLDRQLIAKVVFSDPTALNALNSVVHTALKEELTRWCNDEVRTKPAFFETAIPVTSGIADYADQIWEVTAPEAVRVQRVMKRSALTAEQVISRIEAQKTEVVSDAKVIVNDGVTPLLPAILSLLSPSNPSSL